MSSKISTIYDALVTRMTATFPSHFRLPVAYVVEANPEPMLSQGWAIQIGSGLNSNTTASCQASLERTINVVLTREYKALELDPTPKADMEKTLLEDHFLLIQDFEKNVALNDPSVSACQYVGDAGIEAIFGDNASFLKIVSNFRIRYFEDLS